MKKMADVSDKTTSKAKPRKGGGHSSTGMKRKAVDDDDSGGLKKLRISTKESSLPLEKELGASEYEAKTAEIPIAKEEREGGGGSEGGGGENELAKNEFEIVDFSCVRRQRKYVRQWEAMPSRKLVIALLYLALLYSGQTLLLVDLIR